MSSTTKKYNDFANEPMGSKGVKEIPEIGEKFAAQLHKQGFDQAYVIFYIIFYDMEVNLRVNILDKLLCLMPCFA